MVLLHGTILERLQNAFTPASSGVVGVVDELLSLCDEHGLRLDWRSNKCHVQELGAGSSASIDLLIPIAVFRAIIARLATLCNETNPDSVSPYGGEGELTINTDRPSRFRVTLVNTPGEQRVEISRKVECNGHG